MPLNTLKATPRHQPLGAGGQRRIKTESWAFIKGEGESGDMAVVGGYLDISSVSPPSPCYKNPAASPFDGASVTSGGGGEMW